MNRILTVPTAVTAAVTAPRHEHAWFTRSAHRTSEGTVRYVGCACGTQRIDLQTFPAMPPSPLSRELGRVDPQSR